MIRVPFPELVEGHGTLREGVCRASTGSANRAAHRLSRALSLSKGCHRQPRALPARHYKCDSFFAKFTVIDG